MTLPNGVLACYGYDAAREVQSISYLQSGTCASPGTSVGNLTYGYDAAGRVVSRGGSLFTSVLPQQVTSAVYNADNPLTKRTTPGSAFNLGYDANGNLLCTGVNIQTCSGTSYTWDSRNRLTAVSDGSSYLYDWLDRREQTVLNGATRQYLYDGSNVIEDQVSGTGNPVLTGPSLDERYGRANNGTWTYMLTDALGSTVALSNPTTGAVQTNYAYDPYGVTTTTGSAIVNTNRHTGREFDSTVLYYYRGRYYTPATGRFISEDPLGFGGEDYNLYRYVGGSPVNYADPSGFNSTDDFLTGVVDDLTFGLARAVRDDLAQPGYDYANESSAAYCAGTWAPLILGGGRLAYAGLAKAGSMLAGGAAASEFRNALKVTFRGGLFPNQRIYPYDELLSRYGSDELIAAKAGQTNALLNAAGADGFFGGLFQCRCR